MHFKHKEPLIFKAFQIRSSRIQGYFVPGRMLGSRIAIPRMAFCMPPEIQLPYVQHAFEGFRQTMIFLLNSVDIGMKHPGGLT